MFCPEIINTWALALLQPEVTNAVVDVILGSSYVLHVHMHSYTQVDICSSRNISRSVQCAAFSTLSKACNVNLIPRHCLPMTLYNLII